VHLRLAVGPPTSTAGPAMPLACRISRSAAHAALDDLGGRRPANGGACLVGGACASGFCVDGVCCDTACDGVSDRCDLAGRAGICTNVAKPLPAASGRRWWALLAALVVGGVAFLRRRGSRNFLWSLRAVTAGAPAQAPLAQQT
jgi:hypothetical protein